MLGQAPRSAPGRQKPCLRLGLGWRDGHGAMLSERRVVTGLLGCVQVRGMAAEHHLQRLDQVLQQVEAVCDLHRPRRAMARTLGKGA